MEALYLEVSCMKYIEDIDHMEALSTINSSLQILVKLDRGNRLNHKHFARVYEEKGHVLRRIASNMLSDERVDSAAKNKQTNYYNL